MNQLDQLIKWYIEDNKFSNEQLKFFFNKRENQPTFQSNILYSKLQQQFFNRMPFCNISNNNYHITFDINLTNIIQKIFTYEVDDQTLVLTTRYEHNSVKDCLKNCKNVIELNIEDLLMHNNFSNIRNNIKNFKKIFVYIIGTQIMTGEITPQYFFIKLKQLLLQQNKIFKLCIDDVHGMFLTPRDYSIFDYILYTAHSLVIDYEMGFCISKSQQFGIKAYNWGNQYLKRLDVMLNKKYKMFLFKNILSQYFCDILSKPSYFQCLPCTAQHIFSIQINKLIFSKNMRDNLFKYKINIEKENHSYSHVRIRYQQFIIQDQNSILTGLHLLKETLSCLQKFYFEYYLFND